MNWGWQSLEANNYNQIKYLIRSGNDNGGTTQYNYYLNWVAKGNTYNSINYWYHHFNRKINN